MAHGVLHVPLGIELNATLPDLGHPHLPALWQDLTAMRPFPPGVLECLDPNCLCLGSLLPVEGRRHFRHMTEAEVREHSAKSDEHKAWQEYIVTRAERHGLTAAVEVRSSGGRRIQDVHIDGPVPLSPEVQLSYIHPTTVARRVELDRAAGDTPLWIANDPYSPVIDRAPWSRVAKDTPQRILAGTADLLLGGVMTAVWEDCGRRGELRCPESGRRPCGQKHIHLEPARGLHLEELVVGAATGLYRPTQRRDRQAVRHVWLSAADHERYHDDQAARPERKQAVAVEPKPLDYECGYGSEAEVPVQRAKPRDSGASLFIPAQRDAPREVTTVHGWWIASRKPIHPGCNACHRAPGGPWHGQGGA